MGWREQLGPEWYGVLGDEFGREYFSKLRLRVAQDRNNHTVYPAAEDVFKAYRLCPYNRVKVLILGQDPYHNGHADGLSFSSQAKGTPSSLYNVFKELDSDPELNKECWDPAPSNNLERWAKQGVMLLNTILTVRKGEPGSHQGYGWEEFTRKTIEELLDRFQPLVVLLWGTWARELFEEISKETNNSLINVIIVSHPSPRSATKTGRPFLGSGCFSQTNKILESYGLEEINWVCDPKTITSDNGG